MVADGQATNVRVHVQLKGTERALNSDGSLSVEVRRTNPNYLLMQPTASTPATICRPARFASALLPFTHGRKIERGVTTDPSHKARKPWEYVKLVENMNIAGVTELYSELCEIVHPAAASVLTMVVESEAG